MTSANTDVNASTIEVRMTNTYYWFAILGISILPVTAVFLGSVRHQTGMLLSGIAGLILIAFVGVLTLRTTPKLMEISSTGLYVRQYKRRFDWRDVKRVYVIDMAERMSKGEQVAAAAVGNPSLRLAMLIGLEFTESGLQKHGILADALWKRHHDDHAVIRTHLLALGRGIPDCIPDLVNEAERIRSENS